MAESSACSVMETTRMPRLRSMDLKATGVLALAREPGELPDQDLPEGGTGGLRLVEHLLEPGPVGDAAAFGLVHELADDDVAVPVGVFPERPQLAATDRSTSWRSLETLA